MYTAWHVDKYKIIFKLFINWTNEILQHIVVSSGLSQPGIIDARARYWAAARRLRNTGIVRLKHDCTRAETRFLLSPKRTSPFKPAGASVQSTAGSRGVRISVSNAGHTTFQGSVRVLATHFICQFPLHFPSRASPSAIRFQTHSNLCDESDASTRFL
jgi:hypothetical protein